MFADKSHIAAANVDVSHFHCGQCSPELSKTGSVIAVCKNPLRGSSKKQERNSRTTTRQANTEDKRKDAQTHAQQKCS